MSSPQQTKEKKIGYIHNVSPLKRAASKCQWYHFDLQVSPTKSRRIAAFNIPDHKLLKHLEDSKTPAILKDVVIKGDRDWLYTQQSSTEQCPNSDVSFEYNLNFEPSHTTGNTQAAIDSTVNQVKNCKPNQKVNLTGTVSMGSDELKEVLIRRTQEKSFVKEDCIIEDQTGAIAFHIWSPILQQLKNGKTYLFKNLTVRVFQGSTFLSTSPSTTLSCAAQSVAEISGPKLLLNREQVVKAQQLKFVSKLQVFSSCQVCHKRLNDVLLDYVKCQQCGTRQRTSQCKREATVQICIQHEDNDLWLSAFTGHVIKLLEPSATTLHDSIEDIEMQLMTVKDIIIRYDVQRDTVIGISFHEKQATETTTPVKSTGIVETSL